MHSSDGEMVLHASAVLLEDAGVLLRGHSGSGKSDLALRLIDGGALLVSDDLTALVRESGQIRLQPPAAAPEELRGRMEVRGVGILPVPATPRAPLTLVLDLQPGTSPERLPELQTCSLLGLKVPALAIEPFEPSTAAKVRLVARLLSRGIITWP